MNRPWSAFAAAAILLAAPGAAAQSWPERPVRLVVPFSPGATTDLIARLVGQRLSDALGVQVLVDNRGGGGTVIGTDIVAKAPADGHTLLTITPSFIINATGVRALPYDSQRDFAPVTLLATSPLLLVAHPSLPVRNVRDLLALARGRPGQINYASAGNGSPTHLGMEMLGLHGARMSHIPYKGAAPAMTDVLAGQVPLLMTSLSLVVPHVKSGRVRPLGVTTAKRAAALPEVPAIAETVAGYEVINWWGVVAPAATPPRVVSRLNAEIVRILQEPGVRERIAGEGADAAGNAAERFGAFIRAEIAKWTPVVKATGVKLD